MRVGLGDGTGRVGLGEWDWEIRAGRVGLGEWDWESRAGRVGLGK